MRGGLVVALSTTVSMLWWFDSSWLVCALSSMVLLGLGSNQGESAIMVEGINALTAFAQPGTLRSSRLWRTTPVDCPRVRRTLLTPLPPLKRWMVCRLNNCYQA